MNLANRKYLSSQQVAELFGISAHTVSRKCRSGELSGAVRVGKLWRIPADSVEKALTPPPAEEAVNPFMTADAR